MNSVTLVTILLLVLSVMSGEYEAVLQLSNPRRYRMVEFYYWRESGGRSRPECVVLFLPDVWSAQTPRLDWSDVQETYKAAGDAALAALDADRSGELTEISQIVCSQFCLLRAATHR